MKRVLFNVVLLLSANLVFAQSNIYDSIPFGGRWRTFMTHLPQGYSNQKKYPLVLAFHGGSPLGYQSIQYQSRLSDKADSSGFIVVYPEGVKIAGNRTWNAGGCCAPATTLNIDDVGFVSSLLNNLFRTRSIDTTKVYATGFSNGALLSYKLANQLTKRFAAIAIVEGDFVSYPWQPSRAIPIISFHSYLDQNVKYYGGVTIGNTGTYFPPQDSMFNIISSNYECSVRKQTLFHDSNKYDHFKYSSCACSAVIEQFVSYDGEHSWPGGLSLSGVAVSNQFSATYLMWEFFKQYTTSCSVTDIKEGTTHSKLKVYTSKAHLRIFLPDDIYSISIYNQIGIKIMSFVNNSNQVEISDSKLSNGVYYVKASNENETLTTKFLK